MHEPTDHFSISLEDYTADMQLLQEVARRQVEALIRERDEIKRTLWAVVKSRGGRVQLERAHIDAAHWNGAELVQIEDPSIGGVIFEAK